MDIYLTMGSGQRKLILANATRAQWVALTSKIAQSLRCKRGSQGICLVLMDGKRELERINRAIT